MIEALFNRTERLVGTTAMEHLQRARVILFGTGGVGSWCAEGLVRSGVSHLTIVDNDLVCITNINRQSMACPETVGHVKVEALRARLLAINPQADIVARQEVFNAETAGSFDLTSYDFIIDAIDSLQDKARLILDATRTDATFLSSMGAALKMDPAKVSVAEFWKVKGCPLGAALRRRFKRDKTYPSRKFKCVYSEELLPNLGSEYGCADCSAACPKRENTLSSDSPAAHRWEDRKAQVNGSLVHITAIFGFTLAGLVMQEIMRQSAPSEPDNDPQP